MRFLKTAAFVAGVCLMTGCIGGQKITKTFQDPSYVPGQLSGAIPLRVLVADNLDLRDFANSFEKEYGSEQAFIALLARQISDTMRAVLGNAAVVSENLQEASILSEAGVDDAAVNRIHSLLASLPEDFFCIVNTVTIANRRVIMAPMPMAGPAGNTMPGGSSETAMVTLHVDIWNVKEKKKVLSYAALGESSVTMLFYGTALKNAVNEAVGNLVRYLRAVER